jgi:lysophospholipase L1-like esterase
MSGRKPLHCIAKIFYSRRSDKAVRANEAFRDKENRGLKKTARRRLQIAICDDFPAQSRFFVPLAVRSCMPRLYGAMVGAFVAILLWAGTNAPAQTHWVGSWAAAQQLPEPRNSLGTEDLRDTTLRQIVHLSVGGSEIRLRLSNRFSHQPLRFSAVHVAKPAAANSPKILPGTDKAFTFSGSPDVTIPAGADYVSDPLSFPVAALSDLAITLHIDQPPSEQTGHPGSRATSYLVHGDSTAAAELEGAKTVEHWYFISGVDVESRSAAASIVTLGDSITDGHGATTDANNRWPDVLAKRLQGSGATQSLGVLNEGIGGNRLLLDGSGPNALARFDHDILAQAGVRYLIVLEGVNDLGTLVREAEVPPAQHEALVRRVLAAYAQIVSRAHAHNIQVFGGTILPYTGSDYYHPGPSSEADRQAINAWIREPGHFDAVIDFDKITRDPQHPERMLAAFDCGDHLHPSPAGYAAMANAVPLSLFATAVPVAASAAKIALTFDDLPAHGPLPPEVTRTQVAGKILAALTDANVPPTYGFVNGLMIERQPQDVSVLEAWRAAGNPLGNHSWSHMDLRKQTPAAFEADVNQNEPLLDKWMSNRDWHWFRYPFLAEGETREKRDSIRTFLGQRGYKIAGVTMSFGDYQWNEPYARCRRKGDSQAIQVLERTFLAAADESIRYYRGLSSTLYGRDIPYVLLLHVGAFDAEMLPRLLKLYESRGFRFVTLDDAERDEFYREDIDPQLAPGPDTLEEAMAGRHLPLPPHTAFAAQLGALCR